MKHFLLNPRFWRNVGFVLCAAMAAVIFFLALKNILAEFINHERSFASMYEAIKTSLLYNVAGGMILIIGLLFYAGTVSGKVELCAAIGCCGMMSFIFYGFLILFYGFAAGNFFGPLGLFSLICYANIALLVGARSYNCYMWGKKAKQENKPCEELPEYKGRFMEPAV